MCTILVHKHRRVQRPNFRIWKPFEEPRNRFPAWRAGTKILFDVPVRQAAYRVAESSHWNRFLGSLNVYKFGLGHEIMKKIVEEEKKRLRRH
jgi:hypothetical protein